MLPRRPIRYLLAALGFVLLLGACGSSKSAEPPATTSDVDCVTEVSARYTRSGTCDGHAFAQVVMPEGPEHVQQLADTCGWLARLDDAGVPRADWTRRFAIGSGNFDPTTAAQLVAEAVTDYCPTLNPGA